MEIVLNNDLSCHVHDTRKRSCDEKTFDHLFRKKGMFNKIIRNNEILSFITQFQDGFESLPVRNPILKNKNGTLGASDVSTKETLRPNDESMVINLDPNLSSNGGKNGPKWMIKYNYK